MLPTKLIDLGVGVAKIEEAEGVAVLTILVPAGDDTPAQSITIFSEEGSLSSLGLALTQFEDDLDIMRRGEEG